MIKLMPSYLFLNWVLIIRSIPAHSTKEDLFPAFQMDGTDWNFPAASESLKTLLKPRLCVGVISD